MQTTHEKYVICFSWFRHIQYLFILCFRLKIKLQATRLKTSRYHRPSWISLALSQMRTQSLWQKASKLARAMMCCSTCVGIVMSRSCLVPGGGKRARHTTSADEQWTTLKGIAGETQWYLLFHGTPFCDVCGI